MPRKLVGNKRVISLYVEECAPLVYRLKMDRGSQTAPDSAGDYTLVKAPGKQNLNCVLTKLVAMAFELGRAEQARAIRECLFIDQLNREETMLRMGITPTAAEAPPTSRA